MGVRQLQRIGKEQVRVDVEVLPELVMIGERPTNLDELPAPERQEVLDRMAIDLYKQVIEMFRGGQPYIHDPFEERDVKVVFGSLSYDGTSEEFTFELFEDKD